MRRVPRIAFSSPPPIPVVSSVSTLSLKWGTARSTIPPTTQTVGTTTAARHSRQKTQNSALLTFRRAGMTGQSADVRRRAEPEPGRVDAWLLILRAPADRQRGAGHPADQHPREDVRAQGDDHQHERQLGVGPGASGLVIAASRFCTMFAAIVLIDW
jgi:hypothetical protein